MASGAASVLQCEIKPSEPSIAVGLVAAAVAHFSVDLCAGIWPVFKTLARLDLTKAGMVATAGSLIGNGLQPLFGVLADRGWRKPLLVIGVILAGAVTFVPYFENFLWLFLLMLLTSLGSAAFHPAGTGASSSLSTRRTGIVVAVFLMGGTFGYAASQLIFSAAYLGLRGSTAVLFVIPLVAAAIAARLHPPKSGDHAVAASKVAFRTQFESIRALFLIQVFASFVNMALIFLLPDLLLAKGVPLWIVRGGGHAALVAGGALSLLPAGFATDRFGASRVLLISNLLSGVFLAALIWSAGSTALVLVSAIGFGAFNGVNNIVAIAEGNRSFPGRASAVSALLMGLPWCFSSMAPLIAGWLANPMHSGNPVVALSWISLCVPVVLLVSTNVPRRRTEVEHVH